MYSSPKPLPFLPEEGSIAYVPEHDLFMQHARRVSETLARGCMWRVGTVFVRDGVVLAQAGNNEAITEQPIFCVRRAIGCKTGERYDLCELCRGPHAEATAVQRAKEQGVDLVGAHAYLYGHWWCCAPCWAAMLSAGVTRVYLVEGATEQFEVLPQSRPNWLEVPKVCITGDHPEVGPLLRRGLSLAGIVEDPAGVVIAFDGDTVTINDTVHTIVDPYQTVKALSCLLRDPLVARYAS